MSSTAKSLDEVFERTGLAAKWEARGEARGEAKGRAEGEAKGAQKFFDLLKSGKTPEEIIEMFPPSSDK